MDIVYIDKLRYEIQEQKEIPVWYTGIYRSILSTELIGVLQSRNRLQEPLIHNTLSSITPNWSLTNNKFQNKTIPSDIFYYIL
jgi:hypothetical protein